MSYFESSISNLKSRMNFLGFRVVIKLNVSHIFIFFCLDMRISELHYIYKCFYILFMSFTISQLSIIRLWHDDFFSVCDNVENFKLRIERNEIKRFKVQNLMMMISNHKNLFHFPAFFFFDNL